MSILQSRWWRSWKTVWVGSPQLWAKERKTFDNKSSSVLELCAKLNHLRCERERLVRALFVIANRMEMPPDDSTSRSERAKKHYQTARELNVTDIILLLSILLCFDRDSPAQKILTWKRDSKNSFPLLSRLILFSHIFFDLWPWTWAARKAENTLGGIKITIRIPIVRHSEWVLSLSRDDLSIHTRWSFF